MAAAYGEFGASGASSDHDPLRHAAVYLVGGDLDHPPDPRLQAGLQQDLDAGDIGGDEIGCAVDGPVDVSLGGEVDHDVMAGDDRGEQRRVADVAADEA